MSQPPRKTNPLRGLVQERRVSVMSGTGFVFHGGRPSLDFVNTFRRRKDTLGEPTDTLAAEGLRSWLETARQKTQWADDLPGWTTQEAATSPREASRVDERTRSLREAIYPLLTDAASNPPAPTQSRGDPHADTETVNACAVELPRYAFTTNDSGRLVIADTLTETQLLGFIAADAIRLLGSDAIHRVKECAHPRCGILFEDRSNGMKRQWCSMRDRGNRSKVARFANRSQA